MPGRSSPRSCNPTRCAGSGTVGLVARRLGRRSVLIDLSDEYAGLIGERTGQLSLLAGAGS